MLKKCDELWKLTNGAFDPAIGKIIDLIGFEKGDPRIPQPEKVKEALAKTGWKKIELQEPNFLIKPGGIKLSFNACVPGYAADKVANLLYNFGIKEFLINIGGEIFASGENWTIGIQHPRRQNELIGALNVNKMGISTSGDYEQYFKTGGKRITHIFNPLTGLPANECEAVTIIARDALTADALSTAVFVLGPVEGMKLIEKLPDVEGIIVDTLGVIHQSSNFEKYLSR
jgi:thiamine biosynthesis lipoprotein